MIWLGLAFILGGVLVILFVVACVTATYGYEDKYHGWVRLDDPAEEGSGREWNTDHERSDTDV